MNTQTLFLGDWAQLEAAAARRIRELRGSDLLEPLTVVCGSAAAASHLRRAVTRENGGLVLVDFTTIHRLASGLAASGLPGGRSLADEVEVLRIILRVLGDAPGGSYFERIKTMPGLPRALRRAFKDLREARVTPQQVAGLEGEGPRELASLYAGYLNALAASGRSDDACVYEAAGMRLAAPDAFPPVWVGLYGLYDLPDIQRHFIESLAAARPVDAFVPGPPDAKYSEAARSLYEGLGCRPEWLHTIAPDPAASREVQVVSVEDAVAERREVLRHVVAAAEQGRRFHDIAVVHADAAWRGLFIESLEARGIPVAARVRRPTVATRAAAALLACVSPVSGLPLERSALIDLASACSLLGHCAPGDVSLWDRLSRDARVIASAGQWHVRLSALSDRSAPAATPMRGLLELVDRVEAVRLAGIELTTWSSLAEWLADALAALGVPPDDQVLAAVRRLGRLSDIEPRVGLDAFSATVRDVVADQTERLGSPGRSGVTVAAPEQIRGLRFSLVLFGGLVEGLFPARPAPDPLLDDAARGQLVQRTGCRLSSVTLRSDESDLLFALTCDAAAEQLVLLRARSRTGTGAPQLASRHLLALCRELAGRRLTFADVDAAGEVDGLVTRVPASPVPHPGWPGEMPGVDESDVDVGALMRLHDAADGSLTGAYLASVIGAEAAARRALALRSRREPRLTSWDGLVTDPALAEDVLARHLSVSAVEDYLSCPFVFYARHVLRASAVEEPEESLEPRQLDVGMLVHAVLERVFRRLSETEQHDVAAALEVLDDALADVFARGEAEGLTGYPLAWEGRRRRLARDLREAVVTDPAWSDQLKPSLFEWTFGAAEPGPVVEVLGRELAFRGRVDRIDRDRSGAKVRLLDYKTGKGEAERKHLEAGEDIQLPVYRLAAAALSPPPAAVECAFRLVTRAGGFRDLPLLGDLESTTVALRERLEGFVAGVQAGRFLRMHGGSRCRWCDLAYACGARTPLDAQKQGDPGALRADGAFAGGDA
jgi:RecB family exonuclease